MKTFTTIFAITSMVLAFGAPSNSVMAAEEKKKYCVTYTFDENQNRVCKTWQWVAAESPEKFFGNNLDELEDPDQQDGGREVADSGNEGSTSAASASEQ